MKTRFLPYTAKRISISSEGDVYLLGTKMAIHNNKVKMGWVLGTCEYDVRLLQFIAWNGLKIDDYLYQYMQLINADEYYFNVLECEDIEGFFYIPGYSNYLINRVGDIYSRISGKFMTLGTTKDGYRYCRAISDSGESRVLFRHRALGLTFLHPKISVKNLVINHLDGVPGNDGLDNIEWTTYSGNNQHAYDNYLKCSSAVSIECLNLHDGVVTKYPSISACSTATGIGREAIRWRLLKNDFTVYPDKLLFKKADHGEFPKIDKVKISRIGSGCDMVARNVFTGERIVFTGGRVGHLLTGVQPDTILLHARTKADLPIHGFNFRYLDEANSFKEHSQRSLEIFKVSPVKPACGILLRDIDTGQETFYVTIYDAVADLGISKGTIWSLCKQNGERHGKIYSLHDPRVQ